MTNLTFELFPRFILPPNMAGHLKLEYLVKNGDWGRLGILEFIPY
jgi:hypothetical protein